MILIMCLVMNAVRNLDTRDTGGMCRDMQNRFLLLISHDATAPGRGNLEAYVRLSTVPGDFL